MALILLAVTGLQPSDDGTTRDAVPTVPLGPASISVDGTAAAPDAPGLYAACGLGVPAATPDPPTQPASIDRLADWSGTRVTVTCADEDMPVYACRTSDGLAICLVNRAQDARDLRLAVKMPRGTYTVERREVQPAGMSVLPAAQRLPDRVIAKTGVVPITDRANPGAIVVYNLANRNIEVARSAAAVWKLFRAAHETAPALYAKIRVPLAECAGHVAALARGVSPGQRERAVAHAQRAILTVAHAQALAANAEGQGQPVADLRHALDDLSAALGELSACCLNIVPEISAAVPDADHPNQRTVTTVLRNDGGWRVTAVRLGVAATGGSTVRPAEAAVFASLGPGQSIRATFSVEAPDGGGDPGIVGHYSFVAQDTPAHLQLRPL